MAKTAILLGATGATGREVLKLLLNDKRYDKVKLFNRNKVGIQDDKIEEHVIDLLKLEEHRHNLPAMKYFAVLALQRRKRLIKKRIIKLTTVFP